GPRQDVGARRQVLRSFQKLSQWAERPVWLTVGFFDGVHLGHQYLLRRLREAAAAEGALSLVLTFSNSPRRFHQPELPAGEWKYLTSPEEKLELLATTTIDAALMLEYGESIAQQTAAQFIGG